MTQLRFKAFNKAEFGGSLPRGGKGYLRGFYFRFNSWSSCAIARSLALFASLINATLL